MAQKVIIFFDLDGVLADWEKQYNKMSDVPLSAFGKLSNAERDKIKETLFDYDFFATMDVIPKGMNLLKKYQKEGKNVAILSATGNINQKEVERAKRDWVKKHVGAIDVFFVPKLEDKPKMMQKSFDVNVLIDDRQRAVDAWSAKGGKAVLFK